MCELARNICCAQNVAYDTHRFSVYIDTHAKNQLPTLFMLIVS